jgi:hypothetical protein
VFVPPEQRSIPPEWEPPRRPTPNARRQENAAITIIILVSILALFAPIAGGTLIAVAVALLGR